MEVGRAYFETPKKRYTILDAPGHKVGCQGGGCAVQGRGASRITCVQSSTIAAGVACSRLCRAQAAPPGLRSNPLQSFVPNMIGGASQADIGVLIISARKVRSNASCADGLCPAVREAGQAGQAVPPLQVQVWQT